MVFGASYYDLLSYTSYISVLIPVGVFTMVGLQLFSGLGCVEKIEGENNWVEFCWTFFPFLFVLWLCFLNVGYALGEESMNSVMSNKSKIVKVVGHQWYWSYSDYLTDGGFYDSILTDYLGVVEKPLRLLVNVPFKIAVTSADVIHSFSVPDFNLKLDAIPGRIVTETVCPLRCGVFVGYCSELCGVGHAYMPIVVEVVLKKKK